MKPIKNVVLKDGLDRYKKQVSILKKGYEQEQYRLRKIASSFLGKKVIRSITSVDIATYRDQRLNAINERTQKPISAATVRLELSVLSNFFDIARIEWGLCDGNPVVNVRKPPSFSSEKRLYVPQ